MTMDSISTDSLDFTEEMADANAEAALAGIEPPGFNEPESRSLDSVQDTTGEVAGEPVEGKHSDRRRLDWAIVPGGLAASGPMTMTLHTRSALNLFNGRRWSDAHRGKAFVGGRRFAWAVRGLWLLTARDHPYADWCLVRVDEDLARLRRRLGSATEALRDHLAATTAHGTAVGLLQSASPLRMPLAFASPYGFATCALILQFDLYVRHLKTLVLLDQLSDDEGRGTERIAAGAVRSVFGKPIAWRRALRLTDVGGFSRADLQDDADAAGRARAGLLAERFGPLPEEVLSGRVAPRHSLLRRPVPVTPSKTLNLIEDIFSEEAGRLSDELL
jgi:integrating conjugative element protein (TIGR03761 family)